MGLPKIAVPDSAEGRMMTSYHFSVGNSTSGPIGFCARVPARTRNEALAKLKRTLNSCTGIACEVALRCPAEDVEYFAIYFNPERIRVGDIDEVESAGRGA